MILKEKKHSNQRELGKFIILSYSYNEATVNKHNSKKDVGFAPGILFIWDHTG